MKDLKQELTLVIMAAGMGSRFGGLKQIEPVGPNGEFIIEDCNFFTKSSKTKKNLFLFMNPKLFCYLSIPVILFRCSQNKNPIVGNIFKFTDENPLM